MPEIEIDKLMQTNIFLRNFETLKLSYSPSNNYTYITDMSGDIKREIGSNHYSNLETGYFKQIGLFTVNDI